MAEASGLQGKALRGRCGAQTFSSYGCGPPHRIRVLALEITGQSMHVNVKFAVLSAVLSCLRRKDGGGCI